MTISDVGWDEETQNDMYDMWVDISERNARNYAPTNLLIHPNRDWKLVREEQLIENQPDNMLFITMEDYGDFWCLRKQLDFDTKLYGDTLLIVIQSDLPDRGDLSFIVDGGQSLAHVSLQTPIGEIVGYSQSNWGDDDLQIVFDPFTVEPPQELSPPQNVEIELANNDVKLTWQPVTTTVGGEPAQPDGYLVFYSEYPDRDDLFFYHGFTTARQYYHYGVVQFSDTMYYRVMAYRNISRSRGNDPGGLVPGVTTLRDFLGR